MQLPSTATLATLGLSLLFSPASAQTNFRPGYVLPLSGDTLRGDVDLRDGRSNALRCRFRASPAAPITSYTPAELRGYGYAVEGTNFRTFPVSATGAAPQPYFLEVLVDGSASLYFLRDEERREAYFVASPLLPLTRLEHSTVQVTRSGHTYAEEQTPYRNTLAKALAGCAPAQLRLPRLPFEEPALRSVVAQYNGCHAQPVATGLAEPSASNVAWGVVGGVAQQNLAYTGFPYEGVMATSRHTGFALGPTVRISSARLSQKIALVMSLLYVPEKFEVVASNTFTLLNTRSVLDLAYLRLPVLMRYSFPRGKFRPLVEAGFSAAYALKTGRTYQIDDGSGNYGIPRVLLANDSFRKLEFGLGGGLGLSTRNASGRAIALLLRAETSNGFSAVEGVITSVIHLYGLLSFDLTK